MSQPVPARDSGATATTVVAVAAIVGFLAAVVAAVLVVKTPTAAAGGSPAVREQVLAAARQFAVDFSAYDYRQLDTEFNQVAKESVNPFHQQYLTQSAALHDLVVKAKAVSTAQVAAAGLADVSPTQATAVVAITRTIKNTQTPQGIDASIGLKIVMVHRGGRWLASQVSPT